MSEDTIQKEIERGNQGLNIIKGTHEYVDGEKGKCSVCGTTRYSSAHAETDFSSSDFLAKTMMDSLLDSKTIDSYVIAKDSIGYEVTVYKKDNLGRNLNRVANSKKLSEAITMSLGNFILDIWTRRKQSK